jgi:hypothetical protein
MESFGNTVQRAERRSSSHSEIDDSDGCLARLKIKHDVRKSGFRQPME